MHLCLSSPARYWTAHAEWWHLSDWGQINTQRVRDPDSKQTLDRHTDRQTDRLTDIQTYRHTDRQTDWQTDWQNTHSHDPDGSHLVSSFSGHRPGAVLSGSRRQHHPWYLLGSRPHHLPLAGLLGRSAASPCLPTAEHERGAAGGIRPQLDRRAGRQQPGPQWRSRGCCSGSVSALWPGGPTSRFVLYIKVAVLCRVPKVQNVQVDVSIFWNVLTIIGWIYRKFGPDIHVPLRMVLTDLSSSASSRLTFAFSIKHTPTHLLDGLAWHMLQTFMFYKVQTILFIMYSILWFCELKYLPN